MDGTSGACGKDDERFGGCARCWSRKTGWGESGKQKKNELEHISIKCLNESKNDGRSTGRAGPGVKYLLVRPISHDPTIKNHKPWRLRVDYYRNNFIYAMSSDWFLALGC